MKKTKMTKNRVLETISSRHKHVDSSKKYIIPNRRASSGKKELNVQADIKTRNGRKLKVKA